MHIYFLRHLKTRGNYEKRYIGRTDEDVYEAQAQPLPSGLPEHPDHIFTSPLRRCLQTKALAYPAHSHCVVTDLQEIDFGAFENKTYEDLKDCVAYQHFIDGIADPPRGEATALFKKRCVAAFLESVALCAPDDNVVFVCHGGTIMAILEALEQSDRSFYDYQIANGRVTICNWNGMTLTQEVLD